MPANYLTSNMYREYCSPGYTFDHPSQLPAFREGMKRVTAWVQQHGSHLDHSVELESFLPSMTAFANIVNPADPGVPGDKASGDLYMELTDPNNTKKKVRITFAQYVIGWFDYLNAELHQAGAPIMAGHSDTAGRAPTRRGVLGPADTKVDGVTPTRHDALSLFAELDWQAANGTVVAANQPTYAELDTADQTALLTAIDALSFAPATMPGADALMLQTIFRLVLSIFNTAYNLNFPEHVVSKDSPIGFGPATAPGQSPPGRAALSDEANEISSPNVDGTGTFYDYTGTYFPIKKAVEDRLVLAILEAEAQPVASEAELALVLADDAARTL